MTGRHSRLDELKFGSSWEEIVSEKDTFPSTATCVGLGRSFAWNQWALVNDVVYPTTWLFSFMALLRPDWRA